MKAKDLIEILEKSPNSEVVFCYKGDFPFRFPTITSVSEIPCCKIGKLDGNGDVKYKKDYSFEPIVAIEASQWAENKAIGFSGGAGRKELFKL